MAAFQQDVEREKWVMEGPPCRWFVCVCVYVCVSMFVCLEYLILSLIILTLFFVFYIFYIFYTSGMPKINQQET